MTTMPLIHLPQSSINQYSPSREVLTWLTENKFEERTRLLDDSQQVIRQWADHLATGNGSKKKLELTSPDREISFVEFFSDMDRAQAERFIVELYRDIIPHYASQHQLFSDISKGKTSTGMRVKSTDFEKMVMGLIGSIPGAAAVFNAAVTTQITQLTWIDDNKNTIESSITLEMGIDANVKPTSGRGMKF